MQIPQYIIPASKHGSAGSDSDSDDSECSSDEDEDEQREGEDSARRLTDSPSPTPSSSTSASTASDGSLRTPPSAKAPAYSAYPVASSHHAHSGSYGGLVKSFSLPPRRARAQWNGNNVQRSQTMPSSEFVVSVPHPSRAGGANFLGGWPNASANGNNAMNVDNGSDAEYVGVVSVANGNNGGKKMQALMMPRTYTVPCAW